MMKNNDVSTTAPIQSVFSGPPTLSLIPPGKCQLTADFSSLPLLDRWAVSSTTSVLRFGVPDVTKPLNLSTCACILAKANVVVSEGDELEGEAVIRPYTPISTNAQIGSFDLLVKHYENGKMSGHLKSLPIGSAIDFKHIGPNVKVQAPFQPKKIGMFVGGTGITPMIQALHAILGDASSDTEVSMLYGSRVADDILGKEMLDSWTEKFKNRFSVTHVLSHEPKEGSVWEGERGFIDRDRIERLVPGPDGGEDVLLFVCGPPPMYNALCGPRDDKELSGVLAEMGYNKNQVFKF